MTAPTLPMEISSHALARWAERVRQDRDMRMTVARADMERCAAAGTLQSEPPDWMYLHPQLLSYRAEYLMLGDDVAIVVRRRSPDKPWVVATVMTRHDAGGAHAAALRAQRRARRATHQPTRAPGANVPARHQHADWSDIDDFIEQLDPPDADTLGSSSGV